MGLNRRVFMGIMAAGAAALSAPAVLGQGRPRVVVIGGGCGGATVARYLAKDSAGAIDITLIEPQRTYNTCFFGNLYIGGFWRIEDTAFGYAKLATDYGINVVHEFAVGVDRDARVVTTGSGATFGYDRLVVAPGIDFKEGSVPGWDLSAQNRMPHAYKGGTQVQLLKAQIAAMPEGGVFAMVTPPNPYRCPPGPYERVCMVAHMLKQSNPTAKILIVDPKETFSKQALMEEAWERHYPGMITRIGPDLGGNKVEVRPDTMEVVIDGAVDPATMASRVDEAVFVLGDASQQGDMPKSGFSANSQAKVAANVIRGQLTGSRIFPAKYSNTCWSLLAPEDGVKVGASYEPTPEKIASVESFISQRGEDAALRRATYEESLGWFAGITADMFG
jgi:hypothetical protein